MNANDNNKRLEALFWSIAFPGFGQFRNNRLVKGVLFVLLEFLINCQSNLNMVIYFSFNGPIEQAIETTNYQWLLFYPCVYLFAMWDAYADAGGSQIAYAYIPFVCGAYFGTIGVIYSPTFSIAGKILGPIWGSLSIMFVGIALGMIIRKGLLR